MTHKPLAAEAAVTVAARPEVVFRYFTDSARFAQWMHAGSTVEAVAGGKMRVVYPNGIVALGEFVEVVPNRRIVFTWGYDGGANGIPPGTTRVEVTFAEVEGTLVRLIHTGFSTDEMRSGHVAGWNHYTALLAGAAANEQHESAAARAVDGYLAAWNETDDSRRQSLLESCWATDGRYYDKFANLVGRDRLNAHIANVQKYMPNTKLERRGPVLHTHGWIDFRWEAQMPHGMAPATGSDFGRLDLDGRLTLIVGFWDPPAAVH